MKLIQKLLNSLRIEQNRLSINNKMSQCTDGKTIYFKKGELCKESKNSFDNWYDAKYLVSDGVLYNLDNADDIKRIPVPDFDFFRTLSPEYSPTESLDYVLRMKAGYFYNRKEKDLCSACLWKSTELMFCSYNEWRKEDYLRLVNWHNELGMFSEARKAKKYLLSHESFVKNSFDIASNSVKNIILKNEKNIKYDLVAFNDYGGGCCEKCAKMRGRVYSISGKSKIFPKLPEYAKSHGNFHPGCRCMMSTYYDGGKIYYKGKEVDAIRSSNRPWKDDRSANEKMLYDDFLNRKKVSEIKENDREEYYKLLELCPEIAPKSFGAYRRMKNSRTKNFTKLHESAKEKGVEIYLN